MTSFDRRSFLKASCAAAWAGVVAAGDSLAATVANGYTRTLPGLLPLNLKEEAVFSFVRRYCGEVRWIGQGVLDKLHGAIPREAHLLAKVSDASAFENALAGGSPFSGTYSDGNTLSFVLEGIEFTVENLWPTAFDQRLLDLATAKQIAFAQDALIYDPLTLSLSDPFGAEKGGALRLVNTTIAGGPAIGTALRGRMAADRLRTGQGSSFLNWQRRHLALAATTRTAQAIAETFLSKLATIAETLTPATITTLLRSRAVSTALRRILGIKVAEVIADFIRLRRVLGSDVSNAALWMALLLEPEIESDTADGAARTWLQRGTRFDVLRSRRALAQAQQLVALPIFQQP